MSARPQWSYVQARLQARHGERLQEADWRALEAARSIDQLIERARASSLRRVAERLNARLSSHAIERVLREAWRAYVAEVAAWVPVEWRDAVLWTSRLPELPVIHALLEGDVPPWARQDPAFAELIDGDRQRHAADRKGSQFAPLIAAGADVPTLAARWTAHWRSLWPHGADSRQLVTLIDMVSAHVERLDRAGPQETSARYRRDLAQSLTRLFRRHSATPAAVFSHLALVALDLERLRGGLVRRRLFEESHAKEAA